MQLVARAHEAGVLREDFTDQDVLLLLMANAGLVERAHGITAAASARLIHVLLDGFRAQAATDGPTAPTTREVVAAMRHNGERPLGCSRGKA